MFPRPHAPLAKARTDFDSTSKSLEDLETLQTPHLADVQENLSSSFSAPPIGPSLFQLPSELRLHTGNFSLDPPRVTFAIIQPEVTLDPITVLLEFFKTLLHQGKDLV